MEELNFKKKIIRKPVAFSTTNESERELLIYALGLDNFSGHMKKLLAEDYKNHLKVQELIKQANQQKSKPEVPMKLKNQGQIKIDFS
jgi:hypothetical protein